MAQCILADTNPSASKLSIDILIVALLSHPSNAQSNQWCFLTDFHNVKNRITFITNAPHHQELFKKIIFENIGHFLTKK